MSRPKRGVEKRRYGRLKGPGLSCSAGTVIDLSAGGVRVSLGHSAATMAESRTGYAAGAVTTTHLFNAMSGVVHREPGLAVAALLDDNVWVELIADTLHNRIRRLEIDVSQYKG